MWQWPCDQPPRCEGGPVHGEGQRWPGHSRLQHHGRHWQALLLLLLRHQILQAPLQNTVYFTIILMIVNCHVIYFQDTSGVSEKCCEVVWILEGYRQTFPPLQRITSRFDQANNKVLEETNYLICTPGFQETIAIYAIYKKYISTKIILTRNGDERGSCEWLREAECGEVEGCGGSVSSAPGTIERSATTQVGGNSQLSAHLSEQTTSFHF